MSNSKFEARRILFGRAKQYFYAPEGEGLSIAAAPDCRSMRA